MTREETHPAGNAASRTDETAKRASVERSLSLSISEGGFFGAMTGLTQNFLVPFALLFGATNLMVSIVATLPGLIGSVAQLKAPALLERITSARRFLILAVTGQTMTWFLIGILAFLLSGKSMLLAFLLLIIASSVFALLSNPVWMSYIGDLVPVSRRSVFFGRRNAVASLVTLVGTLLAGACLFLFPGVAGFALLFLVAGIFRGASALCFVKSKELPTAFPPKKEFSVRTFIRRAPTTDFGRYVSLAVLLRFVVYIAAPFFFVYQLNVLGFDYWRFTLLQAAAVISSYLSVTYWARLADRRGNRRVLLYSALLISFIPLLWLTTSAFPALFLFELVSGLAWAGFNLASSNYMLEATRPATRTYAISYFNLFNQMAIVGGSLVGSAMLGLFGLFTAGPGPFLLLFGLSGILRLAVAFFVRPRIKELRFVEVPVKGAEPTFINVLPKQGAVYDSLPSPHEEVRHGFELRFGREREFEEVERFAIPKGVTKRMGEKEKQLYTERLIERTGATVPKKARGLK